MKTFFQLFSGMRQYQEKMKWRRNEKVGKINSFEVQRLHEKFLLDWPTAKWMSLFSVHHLKMVCALWATREDSVPGF